MGKKLITNFNALPLRYKVAFFIIIIWVLTTIVFFTTTKPDTNSSDNASLIANEVINEIKENII